MNCLWIFILNNLLVGTIQTDSFSIVFIMRPNPYEQVPIPIPHSLLSPLNCNKFTTNYRATECLVFMTYHDGQEPQYRCEAIEHMFPKKCASHVAEWFNTVVTAQYF